MTGKVSDWAKETDAIRESLFRLIRYIENNNYEGYDPYDALKSPLFKNPLFKSIPAGGFLLQQFVKRFPFNIRSMLGIEKGLNPVTLGLCIQGYTDLGKAGILTREEVTEKCDLLITMLQHHIPEGYHGACWGYDFPWQSRHFTVDAYQPSIVATGIICNALFQYYHFSGNTKAKDLCTSAATFVLSDLNRIGETGHSLCFSYTPFDHYPVYNANMKAVRVLAQASSLCRSDEMDLAALKAMTYTMRAQNTDGSWFYAPGEKGRWIDSYHTGYILECAHEYALRSGNRQWDAAVEQGYLFFRNHFLRDGYKPAFFHNKLYPIDCTSAAQTILTSNLFGDRESAIRTAHFIIDRMQNSDGHFDFRKYRLFTRKEAFMRWSDAWMFAGMSVLS